jgi:hypothetical protein
MTKKIRFACLFIVSSILSACGGGKSPAKAPDDAPPADGNAPEPTAETTAPSDGIVRDADGDGVPDKEGGGCEGKNETQCKINSDCAWSDQATCVPAGNGPR